MLLYVPKLHNISKLVNQYIASYIAEQLSISTLKCQYAMHLNIKVYQCQYLKIYILSCKNIRTNLESSMQIILI